MPRPVRIVPVVRGFGEGRVSHRGNGRGVAIVCVPKLEATFKKVTETGGPEAVADTIDRVTSKHIDGNQDHQTSVARLGLVSLRCRWQHAESGYNE